MTLNGHENGQAETEGGRFCEDGFCLAADSAAILPGSDPTPVLPLQFLEVRGLSIVAALVERIESTTVLFKKQRGSGRTAVFLCRRAEGDTILWKTRRHLNGLRVLKLKRWGATGKTRLQFEAALSRSVWAVVPEQA